MGYVIGIDIGGTFTDFSLVDEKGHATVWQEATTPMEPVAGVKEGLSNLAAARGQSLREFLDRIDLFVHGSTIATNTVVQRNGPKVGLICTEGFRDSIYFRDGYKPERYNWNLAKPEDFVPRHLRLGVKERIDSHGTVLTPLDAESVRQAAHTFAQDGVEAIAVSLLWSIVNPAHEKEVREILARELPSLPVVLSSDILPAIREWERTCATVLSAYILPGIARYMTELESYLHENGLRRPLLIIQLNGGCSSVTNVLRKPINALASGPAAGPAAALHCTDREGANDIIAVDMGGTSFEVCVISGGRPSVTKEMRVEEMPVGVSAVDVHSIGAGGGSVAWVDKGGALHVGPRSAGALPGPACYGLGGDLPTVTDANLVLGYINPDYFLGGRRKIDPDLSRRAITKHVVEPLGVSLEEAAAGIFRLVNHNMVSAIRAVSIERGIDPRRYVMVVGGGAGAIHGTSLAMELGISKFLIPSYAGVLCSYGMVVSDVKHDYIKTLACNSDKFDFAAVNKILDELEQQAREDLIAEGFTTDRIEIRRFSDAKYPSQVHELTIPVAPGHIGAKELAQALDEFHSVHERMFTYCVRESPVNFFHWSVSGLGKTSGVVTESLKTRPISAQGAIKESRKIYLPDRGYVTTDRYDAAKLVPGMTIHGPAVVEQVNTTVLLLEDQRLGVNIYGDFVVQLSTPPGDVLHQQ